MAEGREHIQKQIINHAELQIISVDEVSQRTTKNDVAQLLEEGFKPLKPVVRDFISAKPIARQSPDAKPLKRPAPIFNAVMRTNFIFTIRDIARANDVGCGDIVL